MLRLVVFPTVDGPAGVDPLGWIALATALASGVGYAVFARRVNPLAAAEA